MKFIVTRIRYVYSRLNDATVIAGLAAPLIFLFESWSRGSIVDIVGMETTRRPGYISGDAISSIV